MDASCPGVVRADRKAVDVAARVRNRVIGSDGEGVAGDHRQVIAAIVDAFPLVLVIFEGGMREAVVHLHHQSVDRIPLQADLDAFALAAPGVTQELSVLGGEHLIDLLVLPVDPKEAKFGVEAVVEERMFGTQLIVPTGFGAERTVFFTVEGGVEAACLISFRHGGVEHAGGGEHILQGDLRRDLAEFELAVESVHLLAAAVRLFIEKEIVGSMLVVVPDAEGKRQAARQQVVHGGLVVESDAVGRGGVQFAGRVTFGQVIEDDGIIDSLPETEGAEQPFVASGSSRFDVQLFGKHFLLHILAGEVDAFGGEILVYALVVRYILKGGPAVDAVARPLIVGGESGCRKGPPVETVLVIVYFARFVRDRIANGIGIAALGRTVERTHQSQGQVLLGFPI